MPPIEPPSLGSPLAPFERRLIEAALGLSGVRRIGELVPRLRPALALEPAPAAAGLGVHDEERGLFVHHLLVADGAGLESIEDPSSGAWLGRFDARSRRTDVRALGAMAGEMAERDDAFTRALRARHVRRIASAPLFFDERLLGTVFLGWSGPLDPSVECLDYLAKLARVVEPHLGNCFTDERFSRGDRRRDALRELSRVINTSLEPGVVLHLARTVIGSIEGHRASWIGLLDGVDHAQGGATWRRHDRPAGPGAEAPGSEPVEGSVLAHVLRKGGTLESDDLAQGTVYRGDEELLARGVRRYLAVPLRAGGKVLGVLLFGTDDPRPSLRMDVWLLENVAVQLALALDNALHYEEIQRLSARREQQNAYLREEIRSEHDAQGMIGSSPALRAVLDAVARVATTDATVLITGPTGVGKELVARAIHEASRRRDQPMVKLNCAAIPEGMVESELFGHERGAFTSAVERRIGRFELAHNGTLFLDEIGELPLAVQSKLLRVLQSGEFERVGAAKTLTSNARIVAATNRDLSKALASGAFRSDLYYRLNVFPIEVPPLEERREDVPLLARTFVEQFARRMGKRLSGIEPETLERLCARSWPGNVRELKHVVERAVILCDGPLLSIPVEPLAIPALPPPRAAAAGLPTLGQVEEAHIRAALARAGGVVEGPRGAAAMLGLKGSTLRFRMKRMGIQR